MSRQHRRRRIGSVLALGILATFTAPLVAFQTPPAFAVTSSPDVVEFVVDVSGSMAGQPLDQAKAALRTAAQGLSSTQLVGLRSYEGNCGNGGNLVVPVAPFSPSTFDTAVNGLVTGGGTPTPDALRAVASDLPATGNRTIVLISDGQSTCGDPCPVAQQLKSQLGVNFRVHAVGFNAPATAATELTCIANTTGGQYIQATDSQSLQNALQQLTNTGPQPGCPNAYFIAAMGSDQHYTKDTDLSPSPQLTTLYKAALGKTTGLKVQLQVVDYPAPSVDTLWAGLKSTKNAAALVKKLQSNVGGYLADKDKGVVALSGLITGDESSCRDAKIILSGYSQGSMVVHEWVNAPGRGTHSNIVGIALLADPERVDQSSVLNFGTAPTYTTDLIGSHGVCAVVAAVTSCTAPYQLADVSPTFLSRTVEVCQQYDLVCDSGKIVNDYPVNTQAGRSALLNLAKSTHGDYSWLPATKTAGAWLGQKVSH